MLSSRASVAALDIPEVRLEVLQEKGPKNHGLSGGQSDVLDVKGTISASRLHCKSGQRNDCDVLTVKVDFDS